MPYNPQIHSNLIVDKPYKDRLKKLTEARGQTLKRGLELLIDSEYKRSDLQDSESETPKSDANAPRK